MPHRVAGNCGSVRLWWVPCRSRKPTCRSVALSAPPGCQCHKSGLGCLVVNGVHQLLLIVCGPRHFCRGPLLLNSEPVRAALLPS